LSGAEPAATLLRRQNGVPRSRSFGHGGDGVEQAVEWFVAITSLVVGASHLLRPGDWAEAYRQLHRCGRPGAFVNGALSLVPGAVVLAGHPSWVGPGAVLTGFGWLLVAKAVVCFLAPQRALWSMERGSKSPRGFVVAGVALLAVGGWACYCLWHRAQGT
jgi:hypothetical protein